MKKIFVLLLFVSAHFSSHGQCADVSVQISSSDTSLIQLYHAGFFLIPSGFDNIVEWKVSTFDGEVIHEDMTSGDWESQSFTLFNHSVPVTDSMLATIVISNVTDGIICTMNDTLFWEEIEVLPGSFIGSWSVLSSNGGVEEVLSNLTEGITGTGQIEIFPSPASDYFSISTQQDFNSLFIFDSSGQLVSKIDHAEIQEQIDISAYAPGMYYIQFWSTEGGQPYIGKLLKI